MTRCSNQPTKHHLHAVVHGRRLHRYRSKSLSNPLEVVPVYNIYPFHYSYRRHHKVSRCNQSYNRNPAHNGDPCRPEQEPSLDCYYYEAQSEGWVAPGPCCQKAEEPSRE